MTRCAIGLDIGGTNLKGAVVEVTGKIVIRDSVPTTSVEGGPAVLRRLVDLARSLSEKAKVKKLTVAGCGVTSPGLVDQKRGVTVTGCDNLPGWAGQPAGTRLSEALGVPIAMDNDANLAAWGEYLLGSGRDTDSFVLLTIGTGIGGGIILNGKLWRGVIGFAGEPGHIKIHPDEPLCTCGQRGCLEAACAGPALVRKAAEAAKADPKSALAALPEINPAAVCDAARKGDAAAKKVVMECGVWLGMGAANVINLLNPEMIAIGGGIADSWDLWEPAIMKGLRLYARPAGLESCRIVKAKLGNDAGVIGAALYSLGRTS